MLSAPSAPHLVVAFGSGPLTNPSGGGARTWQGEVPRMRSPVRFSLVILLVVVFLPGCALLPRFLRGKSKKQEGTARPQLVGTISLVDADSTYVLIDSGSLPGPSVNVVAEGRAADGTSTQLRVTAVRRRPFAIADIVSGTPHVGDKVFQQRELEPVKKAESGSAQ